MHTSIRPSTTNLYDNLPEPPTRPLNVLHITSITTENYYLNNLAEFRNPEVVRYVVATLEKDGGLARPLEDRGVRCYTLDKNRRSAYPAALLELLRIAR